MATVEISNNGAILRITYTVTNNMSTSATYGTSTITINDLEARVTGGGTYYGAKPFYQIQLLNSNGSSIGTYYAFTGNAGSSPAFTLSGSYISFPEIAGYYTKNKAITVTRSSQSESFAFSVVNNGSTARYNHNTGSYYFNGSASFTIADCAYATPISISSTTGTSTDQEVSIVLSKSLSNSFKCQLQYKFGTDTSYTNINSSSALVTVSTTGTTTYKWTPTTAVFAPKLTTAMSGTCVIRCITYSGSTQVGITSNNFTLNLNNANNALNPTANFAFAPVWNGVHPDTSNNKYVQGKTQIKTTITGAAGKFGATIKSYTYQGLDNPTTSTSATNTTKAYVGTIQIKKIAIVTDSRGLTCRAEVIINPISYTAPTITNASAYRTEKPNDPSNSYITTKATLSPIYSLGDGTSQPTFTITYSESGGAQQSTNNALNTLTDSSGNPLSFSMLKSYTVTLTYSDQFGASASKSFIIQSKSAGMHLKKGHNGVAFGKYCEHENALELPAGWKIMIGPNQLSASDVGAIPTTDKYTITTLSHTNWNDIATRSKVPTMQFMSYWNGAYNEYNASNLAYCNKGAFGTLATKNSLTAAEVGARPNTWMPTAANVGAISMKILWTNSNHTAQFAPQTIYLTLTNYQAIMVVFKRHNASFSTTANDNNDMRSVIAIKNQSTMVNYREGDYARRNFSFNNSGVTFLAGQLNGATNNFMMIPYQIYGIGGIT